MCTKKMIASFAAAMATGAILGVLFAPDKGTDTRKKISKKTADVSQAVKNGITDVINTIKDKYEDIKEEAIHLAQKEKEILTSAKNVAKS